MPVGAPQAAEVSDRLRDDAGLVAPVITHPVRVARAYEQLAAVLRDRIISGDLHEGQRLPSETEMAKQAGVSRSTVREAFRTLQEAGLIERSSPRVMVVQRRSDDPARREVLHALRRSNVTFHHLHEVLLVMEPKLAHLAAERADRADVRSLRDIVAAQEEHLHDYDEWSRLDEAFHMAVAEISANPALIIARSPVSGLLLPTLLRFIGSTRHTEHATRFHDRIVFEIEAGDPDTAEAVMRRHVNDFRVAWEKAGLDLHMPIAALTDP